MSVKFLKSRRVDRWARSNSAAWCAVLIWLIAAALAMYADADAPLVWANITAALWFYGLIALAEITRVD